MIDPSKEITTDQYNTYMRYLQALPNNFDKCWVSFLYETDQKIRQLETLKKSAENDMASAELKARTSSAFELPKGTVQKILFVVGTILGLTVIHNLFRRVESSIALNNDKKDLQKSIALCDKAIQELKTFRRTKLADVGSFSKWNIGFRTPSETVYQTAAKTLKMFKERPRWVMELNPELGRPIRPKRILRQSDEE